MLYIFVAPYPATIWCIDITSGCIELQATSVRHFVKCFLCLDVVVCFCYFLLGIDAEFVSMHVEVTIAIGYSEHKKVSELNRPMTSLCSLDPMRLS